MADSLIQLTVGVLEEPATVTERLLRTSESASTRDALARLVRELDTILTTRDGKALVRVDSVTRGAAAATIVCAQASATAGDELWVTIPGYPRVTLTAVAGAAGADEYSKDTSDGAMATSVAAAINANGRLSRHVIAAANSATVTVTARDPGTWAHSIGIAKDVTTAGTLTITAMAGGDDVLAQPTLTVTFGTPNITANDTISIGRRKYTWKASASADGEITLSATEATAATNFAAAINADATWTGLIVATRDTAVVTLTWVGDPRVGQHIVCDFTEVNAGSVVLGGTVIVGTGEAFVLGSTATGSSSTRTLGGQGAA